MINYVDKVVSEMLIWNTNSFVYSVVKNLFLFLSLNITYAITTRIRKKRIFTKNVKYINYKIK